MTRVLASTVSMVLTVGWALQAQPATRQGVSWPAIVEIRNTRLLVFDESARAIPLPDWLSYPAVARSVDGTGLVAQRGFCLYKLNYSPLRETRLACLPGLGIEAMAVSADGKTILIGGRYGTGTSMYCGLFQLSLPAMNPRPVTGHNCAVQNRWSGVSLSADGHQALTVAEYDLYLTDLTSGQTRQVGAGFDDVSWSPDGRWVAAERAVKRESATGSTALLDSRSFKKRKEIAGVALVWSPDSRSLLRIKDCPKLEEVGTLEVIDIRTGAAKKVKSSTCRVEATGVVWVTLPSLQ
jgi:hypothetical protein